MFLPPKEFKMYINRISALSLVLLNGSPKTYFISDSIVCASCSVGKWHCKRNNSMYFDSPNVKNRSTCCAAKQLSQFMGLDHTKNNQDQSLQWKLYTNLPHSLQHLPGVCLTLHPYETNSYKLIKHAVHNCF